MVDRSLPWSHHIKNSRKELNDHIEINRLSGPFEGTYRSLETCIEVEAAKLVFNLPVKITHNCTCISFSMQMESVHDTFNDSTIRVKLSGYGIRFSRTSNFVLLSFSLLADRAKILSGSGKIIGH